MAAATKPAHSPHPDQLSKGAVQHGSGRNIFGTDIWLDLVADGVPVDGVSGTGAGWADKGSTAVDATTGKWYANTGTKASPTWTIFGSIT